MSDRKKVLPDMIPNVGFNLKAQEQFAKDHGIVFEHYAAVPSPIGMKDRGDYRRPDSLDTIAENGFIYEKVGEFTGTILGNSKNHSDVEAGIYDQSTARLVMPKHYNESEKAIALLPGDRIYAKGLEVAVPNYQKVNYNAKGVDILQFPVLCVDSVVDSNNKRYKQGVDFKITKDGNIKWIKGKNNPGIDPDTGKGRVYGIRYTYSAFWYIQRLINEIRITNKGTNKEPTRMPYHAVIQREYVYHNVLKNNPENKVEGKENKRTGPEPVESIDPNKYEVKVDIRDFN